MSDSCTQSRHHATEEEGKRLIRGGGGEWWAAVGVSVWGEEFLRWAAGR